MATTKPKIVLSRSLDIPFNKLVLSQANVRRVKAGISIEDLAEDIARRTLLQSLSVRPVRDADGTETGMYEVPAGGRRFRALELLVKQKRMAKTQTVPCVVREGGIAEEDSLAENVQRVALHPLDQFRAFQNLRDLNMSEEDIAARFFVSPAVVKQRLKLASVSPKLLDIYANDEMSLEQLMAFTVSNDHGRQEQLWDSLAHSYNKEPYYIRRQLTEGSIRASDKRAQFVGIEAYEAAGGAVMRDLFDEDDGGWLQDPGLLDRLTVEKLARGAEPLRTEGWKWIEAAVDFPYGHTAGLRRLTGEAATLTDEEQASCDALRSEYAKLEETYANTEDLPEEIDQRLSEIETALEAFDNRPVRYDPAVIGRAGVFVSIDSEGRLRIERGYIRPGDEVPDEISGEDNEAEAADPDGVVPSTVIIRGSDGSSMTTEVGEEEDGIKPLPDRLLTELTAYRTLALRDSLAKSPDMGFVAVLHALCLSTFYRYESGTCLEITAKSASFSAQAPALNDSAPAKAIQDRQTHWAGQLPKDAADLWAVLIALDPDRRAALFAHCASLSLNAVHEPWNRNPRRLVHAGQLASVLHLDMVRAGWAPTVDNYLGRITKARILEAVREAKGEAAAQLIDHLKKPEMAKEAERLLTGSGWLPEPLRTLDVAIVAQEPNTPDLPAFLNSEADAGVGTDSEASEPSAIAAE
jgi:ParB family chromosome partitioning protein